MISFGSSLVYEYSSSTVLVRCPWPLINFDFVFMEMTNGQGRNITRIFNQQLKLFSQLSTQTLCTNTS